MTNNNCSNCKKTVLVTGGAGYVGSLLVNKLLNKGYNVKVLDLYIYGDNIFEEEKLKFKDSLTEIKGDLRDQKLLKKHINGCDAVIHLACISNDPSFELNPNLGKSINYDAFVPLVQISKNLGVKKFIYASSSSVYGVKQEENVTEDLSLDPLTDYSKYKALCEEELFKFSSEDFACLVIRPATVCGYSKRLRLDLTVNILTNHAINNHKIKVFGGKQKRPNIHIEDIADVYCVALEKKNKDINNKIYNVGYENFTVLEIANLVREEIDPSLPIEIVPTNDDRSYHISSEKIKNEWGFYPKHTIKDAIRDLKNAFQAGKIIDPMNNENYYNIKKMNNIFLK